MTTRTRPAILGITLVMGCYSGVSSFEHDPEQDEGDGGAAAGEDDELPPRGESCGEADAGYSAMRRLSRLEYQHTIADLLKTEVADPDDLPIDAEDGLFHANTTLVDEVIVQSYVGVAEQVAADAVATLDAVHACPESLGEHACAEELIDVLGRRAHRRPLDSEDRQTYLALYERGETHAEGMELVLSAMLQSPYFLYRMETTAGDEELGLVDDWALASRLSYLIWRSMPDDELLDVAASGTLHELDVLRAQAERMLADPKGQRGVIDFHRQWLGLDELEHLEKAPAFELDPELLEAMGRETDALIVQAIRQEGGWLPTLLTSNLAHIDDPRLAELYGLDPETMDWGQDVVLPPERSGILTRAGFVAAHSHPDQVSPVLLGHFVRTRLLCQTVPPPPPGVDGTLPEPDPELPTRERFAAHSANPECEGCHRLLDGIGFSYEGYDPRGQFDAFRTGEQADVSGTLFGTDVDGEFQGPNGLSELLARSETARDCATSAWMAFAVHRQGDEHDACSYDALREVTDSGDGSVEDIVLSIVMSDAFRHRRQNPDD